MHIFTLAYLTRALSLVTVKTSYATVKPSYATVDSQTRICTVYTCCVTRILYFSSIKITWSNLITVCKWQHNSISKPKCIVSRIKYNVIPVHNLMKYIRIMKTWCNRSWRIFIMSWESVWTTFFRFEFRFT